MWGSHDNKKLFFMYLPLDKFSACYSSNLVFRTEIWQIIVTGITSFLFRWISELKVTVNNWLWQELLKYHQRDKTTQELLKYHQRDMATVPVRNVCLKEAIWRSFEEYLLWFFIHFKNFQYICVCVYYMHVYTHTHIVQHLHILSNIKMSTRLFSQLISYSESNI